MPRRRGDLVSGGKKRVPSEAQEYELGVAWLRTAGWAVYRLSQSRASQQTPGLPDCYALHPERGLSLWWECKRQQQARTSPAQRVFEAQARACGLDYVRGSADDLIAYLVSVGCAEISGAGIPTLVARRVSTLGGAG